MTEFEIKTLVAIVLAIVGYFVKYLNDLRIMTKKALLESEKNKLSSELNRVNEQLEKFYGPLKALNESSEIAWSGFRQKYRSNTPHYFSNNDMPNEEELKAWRLWMSIVFMPNNNKMFEIINSRLDLLIEEEMPESLKLLCAHVAAYKTVIHKWEQNDFSEHTSIINFPAREVNKYVDSSFSKLKKRQNELIGLIKK